MLPKLKCHKIKKCPKIQIYVKLKIQEIGVDPLGLVPVWVNVLRDWLHQIKSLKHIFADSGKARGCFINTVVIDSLTNQSIALVLPRLMTVSHPKPLGWCFQSLNSLCCPGLGHPKFQWAAVLL